MSALNPMSKRRAQNKFICNGIYKTQWNYIF